MKNIRPITAADNGPMATIIRNCFTEFGAPQTGSVYDDPVTDRLYETFQATQQSGYWVAESGGVLLGGAGIFPSPGLDADTCELVKIYLRPEGRGSGVALQLLQHCIMAAVTAGYRHMYLESFPEFGRAVHLYEKLGFRHIPVPLAQTGHTSCSIFMLKELADTDR